MQQGKKLSKEAQPFSVHISAILIGVNFPQSLFTTRILDSIEILIISVESPTIKNNLLFDRYKQRLTWLSF